MSDQEKIRDSIQKSADRQRSSLNTSDPKAVLEAEAIAGADYYEQERQKVEVHGLREKNRDRRLNRILRKNYANAVMKYLCWYSVFVGVLLVLSGFNMFGFELPEAVLSFLVGSTAAAAIGLVLAVTQGLFRNLE